MSSITTKRNILRSLIKANNGILKQKLSLLDILTAKYGPKETTKLFTKTCPIIHASIGQHYRHSMDHIELAALTASTYKNDYGDIMDGDNAPLTLRYDLRVRGGTLEKDVNETRKRINSVMDVFNDMKKAKPNNSDVVNNVKVNAAFMLSSDASDDEMELESTIERELGFCAHHAIHHMAMVKVIATQTLGVREDELPLDFGKAPSTVRFESDQK